MFSNPCFLNAARLALLTMLLSIAASAQQLSPETLQKVLDRLDSLEKQNAELLSEIQSLRHELKAAAANPAPEEERIAVTERRVEEQAQVKVSSSQRFPLDLTGMLLFDDFESTGAKTSFNTDYTLGPSGQGATLRQTILGLDFHGPSLPGDGRVYGSLFMDFWAQANDDSAVRLRRAFVSFEWKRRTLTFAQDKPLIAPLEPTSFARVGVPPLSGAGNLWLWLPQVRYEERWRVSEDSKIALQAALIFTNESYTSPSLTGASAPATHPAYEARAEFEHRWGDEEKFVMGVGGHTGSSHLLGYSVPSRVLAADFLFQPAPWLVWSGAVLHGENFASLGGLPGGVTVRQDPVAIRGSAGWLQLAFPVTNRLTFDLYSGRQWNLARDLGTYGSARTLTYAGNVLYRIAPNVVLGLEAARSQLVYRGGLRYPDNRYDATVAYLF